MPLSGYVQTATAAAAVGERSMTSLLVISASNKFLHHRYASEAGFLFDHQPW